MFPEAIDNTARLEYAACPTKFYYSNVYGIKPSGKNIHTLFGGALADGLCAYRTSVYRDGLDHETALRDGWQAIVEHWGGEEDPAYGNKTLTNCLICLEDYMTSFEESPLVPAWVNGQPATEMSFCVPVPGTQHPETGNPILFTGRFDMLAEYNGALYVLDDKTTSQLGNQWMQQWRLSSQLIGYTWACQQYGLKPSGAVVRGASPQAKGNKFLECFNMYSQWLVDRWARQFVRDINNMIEDYQNGVWSMNFGGACTEYGGCKFLDICTSRKPERVIEFQYEKDTWSPLT